MRSVSSVCVYCGSSSGRSDRYRDEAQRLGTLVAKRDITLVYGGAAVGLMGVMADAALAHGGQVIGVIPKNLFVHEVAHQGLTRLLEVESMHERKQQFVDLADAFVALPGGVGTLEELTEVMTWAQLGLHQKPIVVVDLDGYFQPLFAFLQQAVDAGFLKEALLRLASRVQSVDQVLEAIETYEPVAVAKWLELNEV